MSKLFESTTINGMELPNRFVRSATWEGMAADDGTCTPELIDLMTALAKGGVGLIISSHAYVSPAGQASPGNWAFTATIWSPVLKLWRKPCTITAVKSSCNLPTPAFLQMPK